MRACVRECVRECVRACVRECVRACVRVRQTDRQTDRDREGQRQRREWCAIGQEKKTGTTQDCTETSRGLFTWTVSTNRLPFPPLSIDRGISDAPRLSVSPQPHRSLHRLHHRTGRPQSMLASPPLLTLKYCRVILLTLYLSRVNHFTLGHMW